VQGPTLSSSNYEKVFRKLFLGFMVDPNAYIPGMRNVNVGVKARDAIIAALRAARALTTRELAETTGFSRTKVYYHLRLLERHSIVARRGRGRGIRWYRTKRGQTVLSQFSASAKSVS
jgi:DNA-binding transcriptional ArsR family regulator